MPVTIGKRIRWGEKEEEEFQSIIRSLVGETLLDVEQNDTGGLTLIFSGNRVLVIGSNLIIYHKDGTVVKKNA